MADFKLNTAGDIDFSTNDFELLDGIEAIRQELQIRYRFFLGEWFLNDGTEGVPYIRDVLKKNANEAQVRTILSEVARTTPGVVEVRNFGLVLDGATRTLTATGEFGANISGTLTYAPFIVEVELV